MRRASSTCPTVLLILCAPVWFRSSRLSQTGAPTRSREPRRDAQRRRPSDVVRAAGRRARARNAGSRMRRVERRLELVERGDQRLGHVAAAEGAEAVVERAAARRDVVTAILPVLVGARRTRRGERAHARRDPSRPAPLRRRTIRPRRRARRSAIASATFSGVSPPASTTRRAAPRTASSARASAAQSSATPVPPSVPGDLRVEHDGVGASANSSAAFGGSAVASTRSTRPHLAAEVAARTALHVAAVGSACSCTTSSPRSRGDARRSPSARLRAEDATTAARAAPRPAREHLARRGPASRSRGPPAKIDAEVARAEPLGRARRPPRA